MIDTNKLIEHEVLKVAYVLNQHSPSHVKEAMVFLDNQNKLQLSLFNEGFLPLSQFLKTHYNMELDEPAFLAGARGSPYIYGNTYLSVSDEAKFYLAELSPDEKEAIFTSIFPDDKKEYGIMCMPTFFGENINKLQSSISHGYGSEKFMLVRVFHNTNELYSKPLSQSDISVIPVGKEHKYNRINVFDILPDSSVHPIHRNSINKLIVQGVTSNKVEDIKTLIHTLNEKSKAFAQNTLEAHSNSELDTIYKILKDNRLEVNNQYFNKQKKLEM